MLFTVPGNIRSAWAICLTVAAVAIGGCATQTKTLDELGDPVIFVKSLEERLADRFPLSDWQQTKTTLYDPEVKLSRETGGVWVRLKGQTWNWGTERRYRYTVSMLTVPEIDTSKDIVRLTPSREIIWDLDDVPRMYKQQVIDMTYPIVMDALYDQGFTGVRYERRPNYHE